MADITLRDYLAKLDALLNNGASSEVIHHCRHILQYFPKNADTYRYLGRALIDTKSWPEAGEVMRRVLSVYPDDFYAHAGLSEVYINEKRPDDAIWHLERAFEKDPNNEAILDELRELYRKHHRVEHAKVNLTAGAVAQQYMRNGLYGQAITAMQQAIDHTPDRIDLKLLLAEIHWNAGQKIDAAETAVEVLKVLPDCLEANRILAELWLGESRPSDAQRYIGHIQSVDPYLALQLAKGQDVPDDAYKLEELDYRRLAERENATRSPDWLQAVDQGTEASSFTNDETTDWMGSLRSRATPEAEELPNFSDQNFGSELPDDWFTEKPGTGNLDEPPPPAAPRKHTGLTGLLSTLNTPEPEAPAQPAAELEPDLDALFGGTGTPELPPMDEMPGQSTQGEDLFPDEIFSDDDPTPKPNISASEAVREADPLAWMKDTGIEVTGESRQSLKKNTDMFDTGDDQLSLQAADEADPLAWLTGGSSEVKATGQAEAVPDDALDEFVPHEDPLAWMKDSGIDVAPEAQPDSTPVAAQVTDDTPDWLSDESLLDEALNLEALTASPAEKPESRQSGMLNVPPMAEEPDRQNEMADEKDNDFSWAGSDSPKATSGGDDFTWANDSDDQDIPDLFPNLDANAQPAPDALDWMSELPDAADDSAEAESDLPEWLGEMKPEGASASEVAAVSSSSVSADESGFEWLSQTSEPTSDFPADADEETPDWLSQMQQPQAGQTASAPEAVVSSSSVSADESGFEWLNQTSEPANDFPADADEETPDWLSQMPASASQDETPAPILDDTPDWLGDMQASGDEADAQALEPVAQTESAADDTSGLDWMSEMGGADEAAEPADAPDWLSQLQPADEEPAQPVMQTESAEPLDDTPDWLSQLQPADEEPAQPVMQTESAEPLDDTPDWLSQLQPADEEPAQPVMQTESAADDTSGLDWMSEMGGADEAAEPVDAPDWLSQLQPADEEPAQPVMQTESAEPLDDTPDWLSELEPSGDEADAQALEPVAQSESAIPDDLGLDWMSEAGGDAVAEPDGDAAPDWLSQLEPADEEPAQPVMQSVSADDEEGGMEWMSEAGDVGEDAVAEPAGDAPDWLSQLKPADEEPAQPVMQGESVDDEMMAEVAGDAPDWLSQLKPADAEPAQPVMQGESAADDGGFDWGGDSGKSEDTTLEPVGAVPDWLATLQSNESDAEAVPEPAAESESVPAAESEVVQPQGAVPDWLSALQESEPETVPQASAESAGATGDDETGMQWQDEEAGDEEEPAVAGEMPDWLQEVKSTRSEPQVPVEAAPASSEYNWIDDINTSEEQPEPETASVRKLGFAGDDFGTSPDAAMDEEAAVTAGNAPDWLNAMVPGLDVDFDAPEDEQIEHEFLPGSENRAIPVFQSASQPTRNHDFDWLSNIVEEETQQMKAVEGKPRRGRFTFSRLPAWLRQSSKSNEQPVPEAASEDDWSDSEIDLPPWLQ